MRPAARWLQGLALFVLLGVVAFRPLVNEVYEVAPLPGWLAELSPAGPGPATTVVMGAAVQLAILLWLVACALEKRLVFRITGLEIGWLVCAVAASISCSVPGNRRAAITASSDLLLQMASAVLLVQLVRDRWQQRLVVLVILAAAIAFAVKCISQWAYEFSDTQQFYRQYAREYLQGGAPFGDEAQQQLFESRLRAGEASGYFVHSNVAGEYLVLVAFAGVGLAVATLRAAGGAARRIGALGLLAVPGLCCFALVLTRSHGALLAGGLVAAVLVLGVALPLWRRGRRRAALLAGALPAVLALGAAGVVFVAVVGQPAAAGRSARRLLSELQGSLRFRLQYWEAAAAMAADHGLTGVGPANFGRRYLQYKLAGAPEEVQNPHNLLVTMVTEWGWLGALGLVAALGGAVVVGRRGPAGAGGSSRGWQAALPWIVAVGGCLVVSRVLLWSDQSGVFILIEAVMPAAVWLIGALVLYVVLALQDGDGKLEAAVPLFWAGLSAFVLANMVGLSFFVPGAGQTFWAMLAVILAERYLGSGRSARPGRPRLALGVFCAAAALYWLTLGYAPLRAAALTAQAEQTSDARQRLALYRAAVLTDRLDPTPPQTLATWLWRTPEPPMPPAQTIDEVIRQLEQAARRDPYQAALYRWQASAYEARYRLGGRREDLLAACERMQNAVGLYPKYPTGRALYGQLLARAARVSGDPRTLRPAVEQLRLALQLDDLYPSGELRRFGCEFRGELEQQIRQLQQELSDLAD